MAMEAHKTNLNVRDALTCVPSRLLRPLASPVPLLLLGSQLTRRTAPAAISTASR